MSAINCKFQCGIIKNKWVWRSSSLNGDIKSVFEFCNVYSKYQKFTTSLK